MRTRRATVEDGPQAIEVLRRSIMELCVEDLDGDPERLDAWLANKTLADWSVWIKAPRATVFVAEEGDVIVGVGAVRSDGEVLLNYVSPDARFRGVSTALLAALEREAAARGAVAMTLTSTRTARRFYLARGFVPVGDDDPLRLAKPLLA
jgi:GNAT superfamily N-acetyltransferase